MTNISAIKTFLFNKGDLEGIVKYFLTEQTQNILIVKQQTYTHTQQEANLQLPLVA